MSWLNQYFIDPILQNGWFNPVNTLVYSIILILAVLAVYKLLVKMKIKIDSRFALAILPFIFWGASTRVLHDAAVAGVLSEPILSFYSSPLFPTPGSYIITFFLALVVLLISLLVQRFVSFPYWKTMFGIGIVLSVLNVVLLPILTLWPLLLILPITLLWTGLFWLPKKFAPGFFTPANIGILSAHFLDASATFFALSLFGYLEQHVVPRLLFPFFGPISMFLLKIVVLLPVLYIIDRYADPGPFKNFLKIVILILGLAPGLRDTIRLLVLV